MGKKRDSRSSRGGRENRRDSPGGRNGGHNNRKSTGTSGSNLVIRFFVFVVAVAGGILYFDLHSRGGGSSKEQEETLAGDAINATNNEGGADDDDVELPDLLKGKIDRNKISTREDLLKAAELSKRGNEAIGEYRLYDSIDLLVEAIAASPDRAEGYNSLAGALKFLGRQAEGIEILREAERNLIRAHGRDYKRLSLIYQGLYHNHGELNQNAEAEAAIERSCELEATAGCYFNWGCTENLSHPRKIELFTKSLEIDPEYYPSFCLRAHSYLFAPDWERAEEDHEQLMEYQRKSLGGVNLSATQRKTCLQPYHSAYMNFTSEMLRDTSIYFAGKEAIVTDEEILPRLKPSEIDPLYDKAGNRLRKLRIGYVSADLGQHPVGRNVAGLFVSHNKKKYEIFTFNARKRDNPISKLIEQHTTMVDITNWGDHGAAARRIRDEYKIDVLVDLSGWTKGRRLQIFAARPAPIQMTHGLGFVGTVGSKAFDYFITDGVASPPQFTDHYTEHLVRLPQSYLPAAHKAVRITPDDFDPDTVDKTALRKDYGLPVDDRFVFCTFQSIYRASRESFETWMGILQSSPNSVFWMTRPNGSQREELTRRAASLGVDTSRLFWGGYLNPADNIVRSQACDLMLDSWPYNAHSTGVDTIFAGVPMLVYLPDYHDPDSPVKSPKMASRVSASLLHTLGMPQLIQPTVDDFVKEAIRLSRDPAAYTSIRNELLAKRNTTKLFNMRSYAFNHELAYEFAFGTYMHNMPARTWETSDFVNPNQQDSQQPKKTTSEGEL